MSAVIASGAKQSRYRSPRSLRSLTMTSYRGRTSIAKKSLGQHFLTCQWVVDTLIKSAELSLSDTVLEIGPGTGILTRALAQHSKKVIAIEKDEGLARQLKEKLALGGIKNVEVIAGDILKIFPEILPAVDFKIVANIPYYLTGRLLRLIFEKEPRPKTVVLTIQKEVALRITAQPPDMNLLALSVQAFGKPKIIKTIPKECFSPKPKVESAIISISDISDKFFISNHISPDLFFRVARTAFSKKRKMLRHTLGAFNKTKSTARPQELSLEQWMRIINPPK